MFEGLNAITLARIQFAFTVSFHIVFPAFTIGLASWLAVLEWRWLKTGNAIFAEVYRLWVKIFAVTFGMGVVSGVVLSFQFGTNWSVFADKGGNVLGPLLGYEELTAFFLEASFLGVMLFGWNRVSPRMHFASTVIVALGTLVSAFWILSANSWMQTPQGFRWPKTASCTPQTGCKLSQMRHGRNHCGKISHVGLRGLEELGNIVQRNRRSRSGNYQGSAGNGGGAKACFCWRAVKCAFLTNKGSYAILFLLGHSCWVSHCSSR